MSTTKSETCDVEETVVKDVDRLTDKSLKVTLEDTPAKVSVVRGTKSVTDAWEFVVSSITEEEADLSTSFTEDVRSAEGRVLLLECTWVTVLNNATLDAEPRVLLLLTKVSSKACTWAEDETPVGNAETFDVTKVATALALPEVVTKWFAEEGLSNTGMSEVEAVEPLVALLEKLAWSSAQSEGGLTCAPGTEELGFDTDVLWLQTLARSVLEGT